MTSTEDIRDVFSILHDGTIVDWNGDLDNLKLTIDCVYLAERINESFDRFYIELIEVSKIELDPWMNPIELPKSDLKELNKIFKGELEILSAEIKDDSIVVYCNQDDTLLSYVGGNLTIKAKMVNIYDQDWNELTIEELLKIADDYWDEWSKK